MTKRVTGTNQSAHKNNACTEPNKPNGKLYWWSNEPERLAVCSLLSSCASAELAPDGLLWSVQVEAGTRSNLLLSFMLLPFAEIQMSAQDPTFNQAPVKLVCTAGRDGQECLEACISDQFISALPLCTRVYG